MNCKQRHINFEARAPQHKPVMIPTCDRFYFPHIRVLTLWSCTKTFYLNNNCEHNLLLLKQARSIIILMIRGIKAKLHLTIVHAFIIVVSLHSLPKIKGGFFFQRNLSLVCMLETATT